MKLLYRVLLAPLVITVFLVVVGAVGVWSIGTLNASFGALLDDHVAVQSELDDVRARMLALNAALYRTVLLSESLEPKDIQASSQWLQSECQAIVQILRSLDEKARPEDRQALASITETIPTYQKMGMSALANAQTNMAMAMPMLTSAERAFAKTFAALKSVSDSAHAEVGRLREETGQLANRARMIAVALIAVAVALAGGVAWWVGRGIVTQIRQAMVVSEAIAQGRLDIPVPDGGSDELGRLQASLQATVRRLAELIGDILETSHSIHTAASEIAHGSQDLSNRTENAASSLQETAASIEQLTDNVRHSATSAHQANQLASSATQVATRGGEVVGNVVTTMEDIQNSSRKIADIISVIDGIAFQTNILALNAAVEAARAGEQGRGFAVVAAEVRALAQRSASAAKEIKQLITASVDSVVSGTQLVASAGATMQEIVDSVHRVGHVIEAVTQSASAQSSSLSEVNQAVGHLDQMTQQNAALVEQSAAASASLKDQSLRLAGIVSQFQLPASVHAPAQPRLAAPAGPAGGRQLMAT
ncbi:methyl-accepting chemotaxis protein [Acidovorax sp. FJL06]|uniref:methyl-accepting chemotaxis protein n=1 Tax=Acidovorax sp. FJL06 TaxID=2153365 RepID=UPI001F369F63|nr:methyl-accepting chemotaxis protein [Acidovorax sp. FJL06]